MPEKIRVRLLTHASGPHFQLSPGTVAELDRTQAEAMLEAGFAELVAVGEDADPEGAAEESPGTGAVETATAGPQRSREADDLVAAERAGHAAAEAGEQRGNPHDGRSALGRAWFRGYDSYKQEYRAPRTE
jgi:hypothetical protein